MSPGDDGGPAPSARSGRRRRAAFRGGKLRWMSVARDAHIAQRYRKPQGYRVEDRDAAGVGRNRCASLGGEAGVVGHRHAPGGCRRGGAGGNVGSAFGGDRPRDAEARPRRRQQKPPSRRERRETVRSRVARMGSPFQRGTVRSRTSATRPASAWKSPSEGQRPSLARAMSGAVNVVADTMSLLAVVAAGDRSDSPATRPPRDRRRTPRTAARGWPRRAAAPPPARPSP